MTFKKGSVLKYLPVPVFSYDFFIKREHDMNIISYAHTGKRGHYTFHELKSFELITDIFINKRKCIK